MFGTEPGTYMVSAQEKEVFTEESEFEPRIEDRVGICWINQLEEAVLSRKIAGGVGHGNFRGDCSEIQEGGDQSG